MKNILLIATGGTIASKKTSAGLTPKITPEQLLQYVPSAQEFCRVTTTQILNLDSTNITPAHWLMMAKTIQENYETYDGFVICHGTDTMAYTAAALSYLIQKSPKPIVITGSQRPIDMEITDAKMNLLDSLRFASLDKAHEVNIVFDGKVIAGTRARKERTKSNNAFSSLNYPYIAKIHDQRIIFYIDDKDKEPFVGPIFYTKLNPKVFLLKLIPSMDADILDYLGDRYDALIIEAFGVGGLPEYEGIHADFVSAVKKWVDKGKTIIMTTQVPLEGSDLMVYEVGYSLKTNFNMLEAYDMTLEATVTKLMWILGETRDSKRIEQLFYRTVNHDILFTK